VDSCGICGSSELSSVYAGPIRVGRFGQLSQGDVSVLECASCGTRQLPPIIADAREYYESDDYRKDVDATSEAADYFRTHDPEQLRHLSMIGLDTFRDAVVADVGCGAGAFLDAVSGFARSVVAVEPAGAFRDSLCSRGYATHRYVGDALPEAAGTVDVAVSFAVLEHIDEPVPFLEGMRDLLRPGGRLHLSTPNADDFLLEALPGSYSSFFYRKVHRYYFTPSTLIGVLERAGFDDVRVTAHQRFGLGNALGWLRDGRPTGESAPSFVTTAMDAVWRAELERTGRADFLYAEAIRS